ncbi:Cell cycle serine/threonine-protein kinase cdc5/MSD2 [Rhizophlyctis rosea]|uniref:Cell cycle serine/threonine-protein kinase cdc5/MSD2 n=1 Tax=Rhizophlyctis rosea TaxID=64517 RepID=A0AAD5X1P1_9FUNG|nr:Cell cycle serine/threonine-protein kinase cdc5/MSD2 [Rhizophlyctis rosea]
MEFADFGDLLKLIRPNNPLGERDARILLRQLCKGLHYLKRQRIIHNDLKLRNIFLRTDPRGDRIGLENRDLPDTDHSLPLGDSRSRLAVLSGDFGIASTTDESGFDRIASESSARAAYCEEMHDLGMMMSSLLGLESGIGGWSKISREAKHLHDWLSAEKYQEQPTIEEVLNHPWMNGFDLLLGNVDIDANIRTSFVKAGEMAAALKCLWDQFDVCTEVGGEMGEGEDMDGGMVEGRREILLFVEDYVRLFAPMSALKNLQMVEWHFAGHSGSMVALHITATVKNVEHIVQALHEALAYFDGHKYSLIPETYYTHQQNLRPRRPLRLFQNDASRPALPHRSQRVKIDLMEGRGIKNVKSGGVVIELYFDAKDTKVSSVANDTSNPQWGETFTFQTGGKHMLYIKALDKNIVGKDTLGEGIIDVSSVFYGGPIDEWVKLMADDDAFVDGDNGHYKDNNDDQDGDEDEHEGGDDEGEGDDQKEEFDIAEAESAVDARVKETRSLVSR